MHFRWPMHLHLTTLFVGIFVVLALISRANPEQAPASPAVGWAERVRAVLGMAPRLVVTGGGGYNPFSAGRCWAGIWATLNGIEIPERAAPEAAAVLGELRYARAGARPVPAHWVHTLRDAPREGLVREEIRHLAALAMEEFA